MSESVLRNGTEEGLEQYPAGLLMNGTGEGLEGNPVGLLMNGTGEGLGGNPAGPRPPPPAILPHWFMVCSMCSISALAIAGNILAIFCFLRFKKKLKQNTVAYLISLAVSDLWIGFMTGSGVLTLVYKRWVLGDFLCQAIGFLNNVALINSLWTVALGSVDRCFAIRVPFRHRSIMTNKRLGIMIGGSWLFAAVLAMPPLLSLGHLKYTFYPSHPWCAFSPHYSLEYFVVFSVGFLPLPILIIIASYVVIFVTTRGYTKRQMTRLSSTWRSVPTEDTDHNNSLIKLSPVKHVPLGSCTSYPGGQDPIARLSTEDKPMSSSYDTLKVKPATLNSHVFHETSPPSVFQQIFHCQIFDGLKWVLNGCTTEGTPTSNVYSRHRLGSVAAADEEAQAKKLQNQAATLLLVICSTILISYTPIISLSTLAALNFRLNVQYAQVQGFTLLMLSNASINPLIYFVLNKDFRLAAKSIFTDSRIAATLRRHSSFSTRASFLSQTLFPEERTGTRPSSLSNEQIFRVVTPRDMQDLKRRSRPESELFLLKSPPPDTRLDSTCTRASSESTCDRESLPTRFNQNSSVLMRKSHPPMRRKMDRLTRAALVKSITEDKIEKHVLKNSLVLTGNLLGIVGPGDERSTSRYPGLINFSFYEVESAL